MTSTLPVKPLFRLELDTVSSTPHVAPGAPHGTRVIASVTCGSFKGDELSGTVVGAPEDWMTARPDGSLHLDSRVVLRTDDGAVILMTYTGVAHVHDDQPAVRAAPLFQTGDERYAWLNGVQAIAIGEGTPAGVVYEVYSLL